MMEDLPINRGIYTNMRLHFWGLGLILLLVLPCSADADIFENGLKLRAGGFFAYLDTKVGGKISGTNLGHEIDYETDLFLDETQFSPMFGLNYRFKKNHAIQLNYFTLHRKSDRKVLTKTYDIPWGDDTYRLAAGARLETRLNLDVYHFAYMYSFYSSDRLMITGSVGAHVIRIKNGYQGEIGVIVDDTVISYSGEGISESVTAPLPDFGLIAHYKLTDDILLGARIQYFKLTRALMGRNVSTPGGLSTWGIMPWDRGVTN